MVPEPGELEPIERHLRAESAPDDAQVVIRGGPLSVEKVVAHARRQEREFSYKGRSMASISVDVTVGGWTVETILRDRLWSRSSYGRCRVRRLRSAGYVLLPTHETPHHDIVLEDAKPETAATLLAIFGDPQPNPFKQRRR